MGDAPSGFFSLPANVMITEINQITCRDIIAYFSQSQGKMYIRFWINAPMKSETENIERIPSTVAKMYNFSISSKNKSLWAKTVLITVSRATCHTNNPSQKKRWKRRTGARWTQWIFQRSPRTDMILDSYRIFHGRRYKSFFFDFLTGNSEFLILDIFNFLLEG